MMSFPIHSTPFKVKAIRSWSGKTNMDLRFLENDIIEVEKVEGNWLYGKLLRNKKTGYFPLDYVYLIDEDYIEPFSLSSVSDGLEYEPSLQELPKSSFKETFHLIPGISNRYANETTEENGYSYKHNRSPKLSLRTKFMNGNPRRRNVVSSPVSPDTSVSKSYNYENYRNGNDCHSRSPSCDLSMQKKHATNISSLSGPKTCSESPPPMPPMPDPSTIRNVLRKKYSGLDEKRKATRSMIDLSPVESYQDKIEEDSKPTRNSTFYHTNSNFFDGYEPSKKGSESFLFDRSRFLEDSLNTSENSFALMSDFSATSAGSLARHKYAKSFADSSQKLKISLESESYDTSKPALAPAYLVTGMFKKLLHPKSSNDDLKMDSTIPDLPDMEDLHITSDDEGSRWVQAQLNLRRANSIESKQKWARERRALNANPDLVLRPHEYINPEINTNELLRGKKKSTLGIELQSIDKERVDNSTRRLCVVSTPLGIESFSQYSFKHGYRNIIEQLRAIFIYCTEFVKLMDDKGKTDFNEMPKNLDSVLKNGYCTPYELTWVFKKMANVLGIQCNIVLGFLKTPNSDNFIFKFNHCWLSVLVDDEMRFVDVVLGNITNPIHEYINNMKQLSAQDFYFLTQPLHFIYTHIPYYYEEQHIVPAIDKYIAHSLPLVFPSFFINDLKLHKFNLGLTNLEDSEIFTCAIKVPIDIDIIVSLVVDDKDSEEYKGRDFSLVQYKSVKRSRIAYIKAVLPPKVTSGTLHIHSGICGFDIQDKSLAPLSMLIPLTHNGKSKEYEFCFRNLSYHIKKIDLYILEPQNKFLFIDHQYLFEVSQQPRDSVCYQSNLCTTNQSRIIALQSPSKKIYKFNIDNTSVDHETFKLKIRLREFGTWLGLVTSDSNTALCVFAKWSCI